MEQRTPRPRALEPALRRALGVFPVVVVVGPRQVGKSTLVRDTGVGKGRLYLTLDDLDVAEQARRAPDDLLRRSDRLSLDEVQRAPELLLAIKRTVDSRRQPGQFLLTGSADVRAMKQVADRLPGRAIYLQLEPMSSAEMRGNPDSQVWSEVAGARSANEARERVDARRAGRVDLAGLVRRGGLPPAALLRDDEDRDLWFDAYVRGWLERGLADLAGVGDLIDVRRLMLAAASRVGGILNHAELSRDVAMARTTTHRHVGLLEIGFLLATLGTFARNRGQRVIKSPKVYWRDVGLGAYLAGLRAGSDARAHLRWGALVENLVLADLRAWSAAQAHVPDVMYWRTVGGREVDFVIEQAEGVVPIEVKASSRYSIDDLAHLECFLDAHKREARFGVLLYDGERVETPSPRVVVVPFSRVF